MRQAQWGKWGWGLKVSLCIQKCAQIVKIIAQLKIPIAAEENDTTVPASSSTDARIVLTDTHRFGNAV